jgi:hypothetical protein
MKNTLKFLGIIALTAVIGLSMMSCEETIEQYYLKLTGIPDARNGDLIACILTSSLSVNENDYIAYGQTIVNGKSVTFTLLDWDTDGSWAKDGSYYLIFIAAESYDKFEEEEYTFAGGTISKVAVNQETTTIDWSQLLDVTDQFDVKIADIAGKLSY